MIANASHTYDINTLRSCIVDSFDPAVYDHDGTLWLRVFSWSSIWLTALLFPVSVCVRGANEYVCATSEYDRDRARFCSALLVQSQ
jgi:hypothetical protein